MRNFVLFFLLIAMTLSCSRTPGDVKTIDPGETYSEDQGDRAVDGYKPLRVAVSAILSPQETYENYEAFFDYISQEMEMPVEFHQRQTYAEINQMLEQGQLDFAFICTGAYVDLDPASGLELLAIPVTRGKAFYKAYIITQTTFQAQGFEDLRSASFAFTDPLSNTGYLYALSRLNEIGETPERFFDSTIFTYAHDTSIQMVSKGVVEAATVNQLIFDYTKVHYPEIINNVKVIEKSEAFANPPVVITDRLNHDDKNKLIRLFMSMHQHPQGKLLLNDLAIDKFVEAKDADYDSVRAMKSLQVN